MILHQHGGRGKRKEVKVVGGIDRGERAPQGSGDREGDFQEQKAGQGQKRQEDQVLVGRTELADVLPGKPVGEIEEDQGEPQNPYSHEQSVNTTARGEDALQFQGLFRRDPLANANHHLSPFYLVEDGTDSLPGFTLLRVGRFPVIQQIRPDGPGEELVNHLQVAGVTARRELHTGQLAPGFRQIDISAEISRGNHPLRFGVDEENAVQPVNGKGLFVRDNLLGEKTVGDAPYLGQKRPVGFDPEQGIQVNTCYLDAEDLGKSVLQCLEIGSLITLCHLPGQGKSLLETRRHFQRSVRVVGVYVRGGCLGFGTFLLGKRAVFQQIILGCPDIGGGDFSGLVADGHEVLAGEDKECQEEGGQQ